MNSLYLCTKYNLKKFIILNFLMYQSLFFFEYRNFSITTTSS